MRKTVVTDVRVKAEQIDAELWVEVKMLRQKLGEAERKLFRAAAEKPVFVLASKASAYKHHGDDMPKWSIANDCVIYKYKVSGEDGQEATYRLNYDPKVLNSLINGKLLNEEEKKTLLKTHGFLPPDEEEADG